MVSLDLHALAPGETVGFYNDAREFLQERLDPREGSERFKAGISGDMVFPDEVPCEGLRCLETGQFLLGPHGRDARRQECVYDPEMQRVLGISATAR